MKSDEIVLSIVIITRNRSDSLQRTINSLSNQQIANSELIIVNNCSDDSTAEYLDNLSLDSSVKVKIFNLSKNLGVAGGRNYGFEKATGKYVYFIDDDATIESDEHSLQHLVDRIEHDNSIGAIATYIYDAVKQGTLVPPLAEKQTEKIVLNYFGGSHIIRKSAVESKLYPECIIYGSEEIYASYRLYDAGYRIVYDERFKVYHHSEQSGRMSEKEINMNNLVNWYVVKCLLLPGICIPLLFIHYILNLSRLMKFNIKDIRQALALSQTRYKASVILKQPVKISTVRNLVRDFGIVNTL